MYFLLLLYTHTHDTKVINQPHTGLTFDYYLLPTSKSRDKNWDKNLKSGPDKL